MSTLEKAISIAALAHEGQKDKAGKTYVFHLLRVMMSVPDGDAKIVAVLQDVLEDTRVNAEGLSAEGFSPVIITAIEALSRKDKETYDAYIDRCSKNKLASLVKLADLRDNTDLSRLPLPGEGDRKRTQRYLKAIEQLESMIKETVGPEAECNRNTEKQ